MAAVREYGVNFFIQDTWKISDRLVLDYGFRLRGLHPHQWQARTAGMITVNGPNGPQQEYLINPQSRYKLDLNGWGPRLRFAWKATQKLQVTIGGGITTIPPNIWQDNLLTGTTPYVIYPRLTAAPGSPIPFEVPITPNELPGVFTPTGTDIFAAGNTKAVPANTVMDVNRFEQGIAALSPGHQITPLNTSTIWRGFGNGYLETWTFGLERHFGGLSANAAYIGTAGVRLPAADFPNGYRGQIRHWPATLSSIVPGK